MPYIVIRIIMQMYDNQVSRCRYFSAFSEYYSVSNGVRQGGVASPILFIVYVDELYKRLSLSKIGIHIGTMYYGIIGYADDMLLLATTIYALNKMIKICQEFAEEFQVLYNPTKSKFIVFNDGPPINNEAPVVLNGSRIAKCNEIYFLGNTINMYAVLLINI